MTAILPGSLYPAWPPAGTANVSHGEGPTGSGPSTCDTIEEPSGDHAENSEPGRISFTSLPSASIVKMAPFRCPPVKVSRLPSGAQESRSVNVGPIGERFVPSASASQTLPSIPPASLTYAIFDPSGDITGS